VTRTVFERALAFLPSRAVFEASISGDMQSLQALGGELDWHVATLTTCVPSGNLAAGEHAKEAL
jgi:hypothetical protein